MIDEAITALNTMISQWGKNCVLEFPRTRTECPNCELNTFDGTSNGVYQTGGPSPFPFGTICPVCFGEGYIESANSTTIRARIIDEPAKWIGKLPADTPDGLIQLVCSLEHYSAIRSSHRMKIDEGGYRDRYYKLFGDPSDPCGPLAGQWIISFWERIQ